MYNNFKEIKEELFDAPNSVKVKTFTKYIVVGIDKYGYVYDNDIIASNENDAKQKFVTMHNHNAPMSKVKVFINDKEAGEYYMKLYKLKFHSSLKELKEELFDAPEEVKGAFNNIVNYFNQLKLFDFTPRAYKCFNETESIGKKVKELSERNGHSIDDIVSDIKNLAKSLKK